MNTGEKLRVILNNLENKELSPDAFHLRELVPTESNPQDIDELEVWEYKIGEDNLKIEWELEDMSDDIIKIYLNDEKVYGTWNTDTNSHYPEYDDYAEDLFLLIMQHGGILQPKVELDYAIHHLGKDILKKRKNRAKEYFNEKIQ